jgi:hypothetical protein
MWFLRKTKITIVAKGSEHISINHNQPNNLDLKIEADNVSNIVINGSKDETRHWLQRSFGKVAVGVITAVIAAGILFQLGWK